MAAEVHGVNELLNKGSKPENITTSPAALFMEPPTPAGMERVRQHLSQGAGRPKKRGGGSGSWQSRCHADRPGSACSLDGNGDIGSGPGAHMPTPSRRHGTRRPGRRPGMSQSLVVMVRWPTGSLLRSPPRTPARG